MIKDIEEDLLKQVSELFDENANTNTNDSENNDMENYN